MSEERCIARVLRFAFIRDFYIVGDLSREAAAGLLAGPLTPGDDSTIVDDSELLNCATYTDGVELIRADEGIV